MRVVIEGPDGSGKTTLAKNLADRYALNYEHEGPPPAVEPLIDHYCKKLNSHGEHVVFDRLALGELVYGPVLRNVSRISWDDWRFISTMMHDANIVQVLCLPPPEVCYKNWREDREKRGKPELFDIENQFWRTYSKYAFLAVNFNGLVFDYTIKNADYIYEYIKRYCR